MKQTVLYVPIPGPGRIAKYWENWWTKKPHGYLANCFWCGMSGELAIDLIYRGKTRPRNLICNLCWEDPLIQEWWKHHNWTSKNFRKFGQGFP